MKTTLDIVSDVVCPWCWIGLRHISAALEEIGEQITVQTSFRPFFLDAGIPEDGLEYQAYMDRKFPDKAARAAALEHLQQAGAATGIDFRFDRITRRPNTLNAHRLIRWAQGQGKGWQAEEALFAAFFNQGRDVGQTDVLADIAAGIGMDGDLVRELLAGSRDADQIRREVMEAQAIGVRGVPTFIFGRKSGVSGAQPPDVLARLLRESVQPAA